MNKQTEARKRYTEKRISKAFIYLGGKCVECGTTDRLEFDHIDPSTKEENITTAIMVKCWAWNKLVVELDKCQLLCHDHHWQKTLALEQFGKIAEHGTYWRYRKWKCRCTPCVEANSLQLKEWKMKKPGLSNRTI